MTRERLHWPDLARGLCMMAILFDHTEVYYTGRNIVPYSLYVFDVLVVFFFISGYFATSPSSVAKRLLMPYLLFTAALSFPKSLVYHEPWTDYLKSIVMGQASWFICALIVAKLLYACLQRISGGKTWMLSTASILSLGLALWLSRNGDCYAWHFNIALLALPLLYLGTLYRRYEEAFNRFNTTSSLSFIIFFFIILKIYVWWTGATLMVAPIKWSSLPLFFINILVACLLMTTLCKKLPPMRLVEWTGSHSLVYYFLCGAVPLMVSKALQHVGFAYDGKYLHVLVAFALAYLVATAATWLVYRYLPFMTGKW